MLFCQHPPLRSARRVLPLEVRATATRASGLQEWEVEPEARRSSRTVVSAWAGARVSEAYPSRTVKGTVGSFAGGAEGKVFASRRVARSEGKATREFGISTDPRHRETPPKAAMMPCMLCNNAKAAVYCYNDNAYLCKACDGQIHNKNKLAWRHQRSYLCEVCDSVPPKPAVVYCAQDKVRARARISPPEPSRWRCAAAFPRFHDDGKTKDHPRVHRRFARRSSGSSVVVRDAARPSIPERRATRSFAIRAPRVSCPERRALTAPLSPPRHPRARPPFGVASPASPTRPVFQKTIFH